MAGPFYFAWVDPETAFDANIHDVMDESILRMSVEQTEGEFALMSITIKNPRIGFLNAGRKVWAYLSWDNGSEIVPLLYGKLIAFPVGFNREIVDLQFIARPGDYADQKAYLAEALRVLPYYDPVFIAEDKALDPDIVLEGRTEAWCIDRVTHILTTSDYIEGEAGNLAFAEDEVPYDSVDPSFSQPPIRKVRVIASVPWEQLVSGDGLHLLRNYHVTTVAGEGLIKGWPKAEDDLKGGWSCTYSRAASPYENMTDIDLGKWMGDPFRIQGPPFAIKLVSTYNSTLTTSSTGTEIDADTTHFCVLNDSVFLDLKMGYSSTRKRSDTVQFELVADTQPIVTDPGDDEVLELSISGNDVGLPLVAEGMIIPIGDVQRRSYFTQDRGQNSLQYLLQLARANIIMRSRAVTITFKCAFARAVEMSLRHTATIVDRRLPGGTATGKIVGYSFKSEGGEISGTCTIACAIGYGGAWTELPGTPVYVEEGYVDAGYQVYDGQQIILGAGDVAFNPLVEAANDDGLVFPLNELPVLVAPHTVTVETIPLVPVPPMTTSAVQADECDQPVTAALSFSIDTTPYTAWLAGVTTTVDFTLPSIDGGPFDTIYPLTCTTLKIPKQIDLEAASL